MPREPDKVRENRLRRWADRLGLILRKSRKRAVHAHDLGGYSIVTLNNVLVHGSSYDLSLDGVENHLRNIEQKLAAERQA